jgi:hypothetical protein
MRAKLHTRSTSTSRPIMSAMISQKTRIRVTLDLEVYDDIDIENIDWIDKLDLQGDERLDVSIENLDYNY